MYKLQQDRKKSRVGKRRWTDFEWFILEQCSILIRSAETDSRPYTMTSVRQIRFMAVAINLVPSNIVSFENREPFRGSPDTDMVRIGIAIGG